MDQVFDPYKRRVLSEQELQKELKFQTSICKSQVTSKLKKAEKAKTDEDKHKRMLLRECRFCYYFRGGMAGQAFTSANCKACNATITWPNTAVPAICKECSEKHNACIECLSDLDA